MPHTHTRSLTLSTRITPEASPARHRTAPSERAERQDRMRPSFSGHPSSSREARSPGRRTPSKEARGDWPSLYIRDNQAARGDWLSLHLKECEGSAENQTAEGPGPLNQQGAADDGVHARGASATYRSRREAGGRKTFHASPSPPRTPGLLALPFLVMRGAGTS